MGKGSSIEWTQDTWNPVTGCTKVSAGCAHCYAERMAKRLQVMDNPRYQHGFDVALHYDLLRLPLLQRRPRTIFVNSMSDLFHERIPLEFIKHVFATMTAAPWHTFQVLTKRSRRLAQVAAELNWPANVWMGVTVESQEYVWRVDDLRRVPASVRFLSCEPLLGPLNLDLQSVHWVIVGGESGPRARPMDEAWARSLKDQCEAASVPFYFKQWGGKVGKRGKDEAVLDGRLWRSKPHAQLEIVPPATHTAALVAR